MDKLKADYFIKPRFEPADDSSEQQILEWIQPLVQSNKRPSSKAKLILAMSDVIAAMQSKNADLVAWPMGDERFHTTLYGRRIAVSLRGMLLELGWCTIVQTAKKGICQLYRFTEKLDTTSVRVKRYGEDELVEIRGPSTYTKNGKKRRGKKLRTAQFQPEIKPEFEKMKTINQMMQQYPLEGLKNEVWSKSTRRFNEGRLDKGGRIYGLWQSASSSDRLQMTIQGYPVVEVDIKGAFLFIGNNISSNPIELPVDPYQKIPFVRDASNEEEQRRYRSLAKIVVSAAWYHPTRMTRLPRGKKTNEFGSSISLRKQFGIPKALSSGKIFKDIYTTFSFLLDKDLNGFDVMYRESEIIASAMLDLISMGLPSYPVHDSLLCRQQDQEKVVQAIQQQMQKQVGAIPVLEIESRDGVKVIYPPAL